MKKLILFSSLLIGILLISNQTKAGTITIDSIVVFQPAGLCDYSQGARISLFGSSNGYTSSDTIISIADFGDGTSQFDFSNSFDSTGRFFANFFNVYTGPGSYTLRFISTAPDSATDTLIVPNGIVYADTCGKINGRVYLDQNSDCIFNGSDTPISGRKVNALLNNAVVAADWTDSLGNYSINVAVNQTYTIRFENVNGYSIDCPSSGEYITTSIPSINNDFALSCLNGFDIFAVAFGGSVPGQVRNMYVNTYNSFCHNTMGILKVIFQDPLFSYNNTSSPASTSVNGDTVSFNFSNLNNQWNNSFNVNLATYTDTTAQIGDTVCVTLLVDPLLGDSVPTNNIKEVCFPVRTSYDPNIKQVQPLGLGNLGKVMPDTELTYTIHFQNTGTFQAFNVYILDTLDTSVLDPTTIQVLGSSDPMVVNLISPTQNVIKFRFDNINLPDSTSNEPESHGWVTYRIQQQPNLANGNTIKNSAAIYFDYNPPVITESTLNTVDDFIVSVKEISNSKSNFAKIYPNPASEIITIDYGVSNQSYEVYLFDITGKLIREAAVSNRNNQLNVSDIREGIYFLELRGQSGERQLNKVVVSR